MLLIISGIILSENKQSPPRKVAWLYSRLQADWEGFGCMRRLQRFSDTEYYQLMLISDGFLCKGEMKCSTSESVKISVESAGSIVEYVESFSELNIKRSRRLRQEESEAKLSVCRLVSVLQSSTVGLYPLLPFPSIEFFVSYCINKNSSPIISLLRRIIKPSPPCSSHLSESVALQDLIRCFLFAKEFMNHVFNAYLTCNNKTVAERKMWQ